jgi:hypothetical protein
MPLGQRVKVDEDLQKVLRELAERFEKEDSELRRSQERLWKKLEEYWHGLQLIFWSEQDQAWITPDSVRFNEVFSESEVDQLGDIYDYVVDIYKAHGESIISALAANVPSLKYRPDDADDESDRLTAKTYTKIAELLYVHNKAKLIFLRALFMAYNYGTVFSYRYLESDASFGTYKIPDVKSVDELICPFCGSVREANELEPCPSCGRDAAPEIQQKLVVTGDKEVPKSRLMVEMFGPLHVKVPYYAMTQKACGYLQLKTDQSCALIKSIYPHIEDEIDAEKNEDNRRFPRTIYTYPRDPIDTQMDLRVVEKTWIRPWEFYNVSDKDQRARLLKLFPNGCQVTFIGKTRVFAEAFDEALDKRWEIGQAGLSTYIHADPIGKTIVPLQDMRNELVNLTMDTIDHGIPAVYADSQVLDFDQYGQFSSKPGAIYAAHAPSGQSLANAFYQEPKSTMSKEHMLFFRQIDQDAQFASGDFPSIHGGPSEGKSRTLGEYAMSKQMALQRLSITWELMLDWWIRTIDGSVRLYAETVLTDESYSKKENDNYINVWIRRSEMEGKVGGVEPEGGTGFPVSIVQKRETLLQLMELNNPAVNEALYAPTNARFLKDVLALDDLVLPGEDQRAKQAREITDLTKPGAEPEPAPDGNFIPSVAVDPNVDDHAVHISVLRTYLVSTIGLDLKDTNPAGYVNCVAHLKQHQAILLQQTALAHESTAPGVAPNSANPNTATTGE